MSSTQPNMCYVNRHCIKARWRAAKGLGGGREGLEACQASMFDDFVLKFQCTAAAADVAGTTNEGSPMRR